MDNKIRSEIFQTRSAAYKDLSNNYYMILNCVKKMDRNEPSFGDLKVTCEDDQFVDITIAGRIYRTSFEADISKSKFVGRLTLLMRPNGVDISKAVAIAKIDFDRLGNIVSISSNSFGDKSVKITDCSNCEKVFSTIIAENLMQSFQESLEVAESNHWL